MTTPSTTTPQMNPDFAGQAAESADAAIRGARQKASEALAGLSDTVQRVKDQAATLVDKVRPQLESVSTYAREEPTKALLIAAASGAALMGLIALLARSSGSTRLPSTRGWREMAAATAGEWRKAAADQAGHWRRSASDAADDAAARAADAADQTSGTMNATRKAAKAAYDGLSDTVLDWRQQAAAVADRMRPQIETVTNYAKDDPAKALLLATAAGAALMGLLSVLGRRD